MIMKMNLVCADNNAILTDFCLKKTKTIKSENNDAKVIMIVPDQFSFTLEKLITTHFGGSGLNGIEVMTFSRLCSKFIKRTSDKYLLSSGKTIITKQAINKVCDNDENIYKGCYERAEFALEIETQIAELRRHMITPHILKECSKKLNDEQLVKKINSVCEIYEEYLNRTQNGFYDSDNDMLTLSDLIVSELDLSDTTVIVHDFSDFLPQHYKVIESLFIKSKELFVTLPFDENPDFNEICKKTFDKLVYISNRHGFLHEKILLEKTNSQFNSKEIEFYKHNYSKYSKKSFVPYKEKTNDIHLFSAKDPYTETEHTAKVIKKLIEEGNYRYSDISVVLGEPDDYHNIIEAVFKDYNIPYFTDIKAPATEHQIILGVLGVFDIIDSNWSYDSVFRYLKSGFIYEEKDGAISQLSNEDIDLLESYVLKQGIRGKKKWLDDCVWVYKKGGIADFEDESPDKNDEYSLRINRVKTSFTTPIKTLLDKISNRRSARELSKAFYEFLQDIHLYDAIVDKINKLNEKGLKNEAGQFSMVWTMLLEVMDQCVLTLGDEKCSKKDFRDFLFAGLSTCNFELIPSSIDSVTVGKSDLSSKRNTKALFVLGSLRGVIPKNTANETIFSDNDRSKIDEILKENDIELGQDIYSVMTDAEYRFYKVLFSATDCIYISYPVNNFEGEAQIPAQFVYNLHKIFENLDVCDDISYKNNSENLIFSPKSAFNYLMENYNKMNDPKIKKLYDWFNSNPKWRDKLRIIDSANNYKIEHARISAEAAQLLYENRKSYSVTALNEFSSCPFKYYLKYGLGIKEQEIWKIQKLDLGILMHLAICNYCKAVENGANTFEELKLNWTNLTKDESEKLVDKIMNEIKEKLLSSLERDEDKVLYLIERMKKTIKRSVETVRLSLNNGMYAPAEHEKDFKIQLTDEDDSVMIRGTIDRIDVAKSESNICGKMRIIDYKSGKKDFSVVSISNMLDIQLIVYASCATQLYKNGSIRYTEGTTDAEVCAILYNKIRDDLKSEDINTIKNSERELQKIMKLNGLIILDKDSTGENSYNFDIENALMMDRDLITNKESSYLNIKLKNDLTPYQNSDISTRDEFNKLLEYVKKNIILIDKKIKSGDISILPYKNESNDACSFCEMSEICLFDEDKDCVRKLITNKEDAWCKINEELK